MALALTACGGDSAPAEACNPEVERVEGQNLLPSDSAGDSFGSSVAVGGDVAVVGAPFRGGQGRQPGAAYVFVRTGGVWSEQQKLLPSDGAPRDGFGASVAIDGETVFLRALPGEESGAAYVFVRTGAVWAQQQKLDGVDGYSVAVSGDTAVVGTTVWVRSGDVWSEQQKLTNGTSVGISGDTAIVGDNFDEDYFHQDDEGRVVTRSSAHVFVRTADTWSEQQKLLTDDSDLRGVLVAVSGDTAILAAPVYVCPDHEVSAAAAYVFVRTEGVWAQQEKLVLGAAGTWVRAASGGDTIILADSGAAWAYPL